MNKKTARALGEIGENEVTRTDHQGTAYKTKGPTSTEDVNEFIIMPKSEVEK